MSAHVMSSRNKTTCSQKIGKTNRWRCKLLFFTTSAETETCSQSLNFWKFTSSDSMWLLWNTLLMTTSAKPLAIYIFLIILISGAVGKVAMPAHANLTTSTESAKDRILFRIIIVLVPIPWDCKRCWLHCLIGKINHI